MWPPYITSPKMYCRSCQGTGALAAAATLRYSKSTFAHTVRSPVLKAYLRLKPCWPKRRRPSTMLWYQVSVSRQALNSVG